MMNVWHAVWCMCGNQCNRFQDNNLYDTDILCIHRVDTKEEVELQTEYNQTYSTLVTSSCCITCGLSWEIAKDCGSLTMPFIKLRSTLIEKRPKLQEAGVNHTFQAFMQLMRSECGRGHVTRSTGLFRPGIKGLITHAFTDTAASRLPLTWRTNHNKEISFRWGLFYKSKHLLSPTQKRNEEDIKDDNRCFSSSLQNAEAINWNAMRDFRNR